MRLISRFSAIQNTKTRFINLSTAAIVAVASLSGAMPLFLSGSAAAATVTCDASCDVATAVANAMDGDVITLSGTHAINTQINVNKDITITGSGATILTNGGSSVFVTTAPGVTISNLVFTKTDKVTQNIVSVQSADTTIDSNTFSGLYTVATNDHTSRALDVSTVSNVTITNNDITNLRQPAYINNGATGVLTNNYVAETRGWVVEAGSDFDIYGNTWGTGAQRNAVDIAIINGTPNNYPSVMSLSADNSDAAVENQVSSQRSTVYVDANAPTGGNGYWNSPYQTISQAMAVVADSGTVYVADGTYIGDVTINKSVQLLGPNAGNNANGSRSAEAVIIGQVNVYSGFVNFDGFTVTNPLWNGATVKGVHVYSTTGMNFVNIKNNIIRDINNANAKGAYGIMVQGNVSNVTITDNLVDDLYSAGWAHGVEVTPSAGSSAVPTGVVITGNTIQNIANAGGNDQYAFSVDAAGSLTADASEITFTNNRVFGAVRNLDNAPLNANNNYWGQPTGPSAGQVSGPVAVASWCEQNSCATTRTTNTPTATPTTGSTTTTTSSTSRGNSVATTNSATGDVTSEEATSTGVLGEAAGTDSSSTKKSNSDKSDDKKDDKKDSSAFLGLGWWWIPVIVAVLAVLGYVFGVRRNGRE